jgi:hypothetical protein
MEYVLDGKIVGNSVIINDINYPRQAYADLAQLVPVASIPTLTDSQVIDWNDGSEVDGKWVRFTVRDKTSDEKMSEIRGKRDSLLSDTDWTGMSDVTMSADMVTYRQALRDLPATVNVDTPVYPTKP